MERNKITFREAADILGLTEQGLEHHWYERCLPGCPCHTITKGMKAHGLIREFYEDDILAWAAKRHEGLDKG